MSDIIQLLPDSIANQIAAGEVVQRPASVVKELLENSIDAGGSSIQLIVKDGGKSLIQVIDDGIGMSDTDARLSFERHATSKIHEATDLFKIRTMGFRGEALASIAAVAEVELKTRREGDDVGTFIKIGASEVISQEPVNCIKGANFSIKNLFFNVPARRKFLKSTSVELKHVIIEFQRVALAYPNISFTLTHNGSDLYKLNASGLKQRVVSLFGKSANNNLLDCDAQTTILNLYGYIGKPEGARKSTGEQFFFVNGRYMKNPFLHKAVVNAYNRLLPPDTIPSYFLYIDIDPESIDVNIHPTKTEIKFEDERAVWQIVHAAAKESLGKFGVVPSIDFSAPPDFDIPYFPKSAPATIPEVDVNTNFNPFEEEGVKFKKSGENSHPFTKSFEGWENLFEGNVPNEESTQTTIQTFESKGFDNDKRPLVNRFFQLKGRYILTNMKSGLLLIDQKRAHERILYEQFIQGASSGNVVSQRVLYPQVIDLKPDEYTLLIDHLENLQKLGLEISDLNHNSVSITGVPASLSLPEPSELIQNILAVISEEVVIPALDMTQKVAVSMAKSSAIGYNRILSNIEMQELFDKLFACKEPNYTPDGKKILILIDLEELHKRFS